MVTNLDRKNRNIQAVNDNFTKEEIQTCHSPICYSPPIPEPSSYSNIPYILHATDPIYAEGLPRHIRLCFTDQLDYRFTMPKASCLPSSKTMTAMRVDCVTDLLQRDSPPPQCNITAMTLSPNKHQQENLHSGQRRAVRQEKTVAHIHFLLKVGRMSHILTKPQAKQPHSREAKVKRSQRSSCHRSGPQLSLENRVSVTFTLASNMKLCCWRQHS